MTAAGSGWIVESEAADDLDATFAAKPFDTLDLDLLHCRAGAADASAIRLGRRVAP